jgi:hypothetical protein
MKRKIFLLIVIFLTSIYSKNCFAQLIQLTILSVDSFPVLPQDTAYEANQNQYNFLVHVFNMANNQVTVNDTCRIFLKNTDTTFSTTEILASTPVGTLFGFDFINIPVNNYQFTPATYKAGNNIVVVWPRIGNGTNTTFDSLQIDTVYFVPLLSMNMLNVQNQTFTFFPNPAIDQIIINSDREKYIDYVRILNDLGQTILYRRSAGKYLDVKFLSEGFYFIEIRDRNGTISRKKFLKL